jgi:hypothetical protein
LQSSTNLSLDSLSDIILKVFICLGIIWFEIFFY